MIDKKIFSYDTLIGTYQIDKKICDEIVNYAKLNKHLYVEGGVGDRFEKLENVKVSYDMSIANNRFDHPFKNYREELDKCVDEYIKEYKDVNHLDYFGISEGINIQKYPIGGGFKKWHFENSGLAKSMKRHLVFMTYLNDVKDGGTEFKYQKVTSPCKKGLTIIWPAYWTHTHRGVVSKTKEKYIITGWFSTLKNE